MINKQIENFLKDVTIIDTETTHHEPAQAEIVEVGSCNFDEDTGTFKIRDMLIKPYNDIPFAASSKNNISRRMLKDKPHFKECFEEAFDILNFKNTKYVVAHNVSYDKTVIHKECGDIGRRDLASNREGDTMWICTFKLSKILFQDIAQETEGFSHALNYLRFFFDIDRMDDELLDSKINVQPHRAGDDSFTCAKFLLQIIDYVVKNDMVDPETEDIGEFLWNLQNTIIVPEIMPFGKHKGKAFGDIDSGYFKWCFKNMDLFDEDHRNFDQGLTTAMITTMMDRGEI